MCYRFLRVFLVVVGLTLILVAGFPILLLWHPHVAWETAFMAAKLLMLPIGALCLIGAAGMSRYSGR